MAEIKRLSEGDTAAIVNLEAACFSDGWTENMVRDSFYYPNAQLWGIYESDVLAGYYAAGQVADEGELMSICVLPEFRGRGFGKMLLNHMEETLKQLGSVQIFLEVRESNRSARNLYSSSGFKEMGIRRNYYSNNGENAIIMMKM